MSNDEIRAGIFEYLTCMGGVDRFDKLVDFVINDVLPNHYAANKREDEDETFRKFGKVLNLIHLIEELGADVTGDTEAFHGMLNDIKQIINGNNKYHML